MEKTNTRYSCAGRLMTSYILIREKEPHGSKEAISHTSTCMMLLGQTEYEHIHAISEIISSNVVYKFTTSVYCHMEYVLYGIPAG